MYLIIIFLSLIFAFFFSFYAASNLAGRIRIKRSPRPPPRRAPTTKIAFCALFTRKFELFSNLKGGAAAGRPQPPPLIALGLRPRKLLKMLARTVPPLAGLKKKRKNFKGATGGINKKLLSVTRLRHQKKQFLKLLTP